MTLLHHVPFSRSFRTLWLLEELGEPCDIAEYSIVDGSLKTPEYLARSPAGRVPSLDIDGLTLTESGAIAEYLCETRPEAGLGRAVGDPERTAFLEWIHFSETMASLLETLNLCHIFLRDPAQASPTVIKVTTARLTVAVRGMEDRMPEDGYLLSSGFSAADTMMGFNLFAVPFYVKMDAFPKLLAYRARLEAREAFQRARARDGEQTFYSKPFYPVPEG